MLDYSKKISILFLAVLLLIVVFFSPAQASLWDTISAWVTINPLEVKVSAPAETEINKVFKVESKIINRGEEKIENVKGEIFLPPELVLIQKEPIKEIGIIPGKREKTVFWSVKGEKVGSHVVLVSVLGKLKGESITAEGSAVVEVQQSVRKRGRQQWFQNLFDFFRSRF